MEPEEGKGNTLNVQIGKIILLVKIYSYRWWQISSILIICIKTLDYKLVKSGHECKSSDFWLGWENSLTECAKTCANTNGCHFFIYGTEGNTEKCYWEKTSSPDCPDGWEEDEYNFYEISSKWCWKFPRVFRIKSL